MKIKLSPLRMDERFEARVSGDTIIVNGLTCDFSSLQEGEFLAASSINFPCGVGDITRTNGEICLTLILPHGATSSHATRFPAAFYEPITVTDGIVPLPSDDMDVSDD